MAFGQPQSADPYADLRQGFIDLPQHPMAAAVAPKRNWLGVLADALSGAAGQQPLYTQSLMLQKQDDRDEKRYQLRQNAELDQQKSLYLWKQAHPDTPAPDGYERALTAAGITPGMPEYTQHMLAHVNAADDPVVTVTLPGNRVYSGPRSGLAAALSGATSAPPRPVGNLTPIGGPMPSASGGFR